MTNIKPGGSTDNRKN